MSCLKTVIKIIGAMSVFWVATIHAESKSYSVQSELVEQFVQEMVSQHNFDRAHLEQLFSEVKHKENIIRLMTSPAEAKPWKDYRPILVTQKRTEQGIGFMKENREALERAELEFGVPPEIIVAIIGVETRYGRVTGSYRVIDALATLAFDYPKRAKFFRKELKEFLLLTRAEKVDPRTLMGSYAGAMGYGQFMPSSFRAYAIDFDGDGAKDIWHNVTDAIGSVANYFHRHGWRKGELVTAKATPQGSDFDSILVKKRRDLKPKFTLAELIEKGFITDAELAANQPATAMKLRGAEGNEYWVGLHNFYVITRYNHSALYAMAVYQLSQQIAKQQVSG